MVGCMTVFVGRHGAPAFEFAVEYYAHRTVPEPGSPDTLSALGEYAAAGMGKELLGKGFFVPGEDMRVALSRHPLAEETAYLAGFPDNRWVQSALLDEVELDMGPAALGAMLAKNKLPQAVLRHAALITEHPPEPRFWITHGLVIAGLCKVLGVPTRPLVPDYGEIRMLPLDRAASLSYGS